MSVTKSRISWRRRQSLTACEAVVLGLVIGLAAATVASFMPPRDFSFGYLLTLLVSIGPFGGLTGYVLWLVTDPVREQRLRTWTVYIGLSVIVGSFILVPEFWLGLARMKTAPFLPMFIGFAFAVAAYVVAAVTGLLYLGRHLASASSVPADPTRDGIWDRELDGSQ